MIAEIYRIDGIDEISFASLPKEIYNTKFYISTDEEYNSVNKLVKEIVNFNISKINKNINDILVEFYFGSQNDSKVNFVNNKNIFSLLSSMTVLDDSNDSNVHDIEDSLNIFTNINFNSYKYKKYRKQESGKKIITTTTKKNRHIIYNGENANIFINKNKHNSTPIILFINIWDKQVVIDDKIIPTIEIDHKLSFTSLTLTSLTFIEESPQQIDLNNNLNNEFFENILYKNNTDCLKFLFTILQEHNYKNVEFTDIYDIKKEETKKLKIKYGDVINDIQDINNSYMKQNRFYQRFQTKIFGDEICNFIIKETEEYVNKNGWDKDNFKNYPTLDLKLSKLTNIHDYFLKYELGKIMNYIEKSYCLPNETRFDITDLNIIKYSADLQTHLDYHKDSSFITFNIALNGKTEYEGGGTYFDDGLIFNIDKGEMIVHCGNVIHRGLTVTNGVRYILVGFINIIYEA